jgi:asparagine synthase (glutamine-hydrolysing)
MKSILPEALYRREKFAFMAPPGHTDDKKEIALERLIEEFMNESMIREVGLFDRKRLAAFIEGYRRDKDPVSLVRKDALINHLLGIHILWRHFIGEEVGAGI